MSLQARMSEHDPRLYNVNRDVAHCFGSLVEEVAGRLEDGNWKHLQDLLNERGVTDEQLGEACKAFLLFVAGAADDPKESMSAAMVRSGWFDVSEDAHIAFMALLGTVMSGVFWTGIKEATLGGEGPCQSLQHLRERGREAHRLLTMPRWKRKLAKVGAAIERVRGAFKTES